MEEKDWFWQEDAYKLDAESPLAISRSLWDGLAQSEADSRSLFASTPPTSELTDASRMLSSYCRKECEASRDVYPDAIMQEGSPRLKRRRMLMFPSSREETSSCHPPGDTMMDHLDSRKEECGGPMIPTCDDFGRYEVPLPSSNSLWYLRDDESQLMLDKALEPASDNWMVRSYDDLHGRQQIVPVSEISGSCSVNQEQEQEFEFSDCPSIPYGEPSTPGSRSTAQYTKPKSVTPVAYPFNLLKPSRAQGDVTLTDINQRLSLPPSRPSHFPGDRRLAQTVAGGLSGKSVVHRTKIHTQGDGCITIMRTRG